MHEIDRYIMHNFSLELISQFFQLCFIIGSLEGWKESIKYERLLN